MGYDQASIGNADGFGAHGTGAKFIECRAWDNSDDNYDCINSYGRNIFDTCWSFRLNLATSNIEDGNGFKVGGFNKDPNARTKLNGGVPLHILLKIVFLQVINLMDFMLIINRDKLLFGLIIGHIIIKLILI